jgi:hypothetical protein
LLQAAGAIEHTARTKITVQPRAGKSLFLFPGQFARQDQPDAVHQVVQQALG